MLRKDTVLLATSNNASLMFFVTLSLNEWLTFENRIRCLFQNKLYIQNTTNEIAQGGVDLCRRPGRGGWLSPRTIFYV